MKTTTPVSIKASEQADADGRTDGKTVNKENSFSSEETGVLHIILKYVP